MPFLAVAIIISWILCGVTYLQGMVVFEGAKVPFSRADFLFTKEGFYANALTYNVLTIGILLSILYTEMLVIGVFMLLLGTTVIVVALEFILKNTKSAK